MGHYSRSSISTSPHPYPSSVTATLCMSSFAISMSHFSHLRTFILKLHPHFSFPLSSANTTTISTCTLLAPDRSGWEISFWLISMFPDANLPIWSLAAKMLPWTRYWSPGCSWCVHECKCIWMLRRKHLNIKKVLVWICVNGGIRYAVWSSTQIE